MDTKYIDEAIIALQLVIRLDNCNDCHDLPQEALDDVITAMQSLVLYKEENSDENHNRNI